MILAIESSCDETAAAIINDGQIISNECITQIKRHSKYGGVVPELASRLHAECIDTVIDIALKNANASFKDIDHIAVTVGPGLEGSLLVGVVAANMLASQLKCPVIPVNHLHGHIYSAMADYSYECPMLACIASGGHTMLVYLKDSLSFEIVANTMDDACGECFDKVARMLGLNYPGGPFIEKAALEGDINITLPHPVKHDSGKFSFSGLKTAVFDLVKRYETVPVHDISASFQDHVGQILLHKIQQSLDQYSCKQLLLCGGVFSNKHIRKVLMDNVSGVDVIIPELSLCTDNAAMIGLAATQYLNQFKQLPTFVDVQTRLGLKLPKELL